MSAFGEFWRLEDGEWFDVPTGEVADADINRHFSWLVAETAQGTNRHLIGDGVLDASLRTKAVRDDFQAFKSAVMPLFLHDSQAKREPSEVDFHTPKSALDAMSVIQDGQTRISRLVKQAIRHSRAIPKERNDDPALGIVSPLQVVFQFLTIPSVPGSSAYSLFTIRQYIYESVGIFPVDIVDDAEQSFSLSDIERTYSVFDTSWRARPGSLGKDKVPIAVRQPETAVVRHFLGARGYLTLRFSNREDLMTCLLSHDLFHPKAAYEFDRAPNLKRLPDVGEISNEMLGLPLPIRGADTIFRGALKFSSKGGLVVALHGGAGTGKTALSLAIGAALSGLGIQTLFLTAEEEEGDLRNRVSGLVANEVQRLDFVSSNERSWLKFLRLDHGADLEREVSFAFDQIADRLEKSEPVAAEDGSPAVCRTVVVLDGVQDIFRRASEKGKADAQDLSDRLQKLVQQCRKLKALVILTTGVDWEADKSLDYMVDVAMTLSHETSMEKQGKPHRSIELTKARHQLCAPGLHTFQIAGDKGVRFTPQMNYQIDRKSIWTPKLPDADVYKDLLHRGFSEEQHKLFPAHQGGRVRGNPQILNVDNGTKLFRRSNIFLNGEGSGGKAALALKIATAPVSSNGDVEALGERVLVVSFLYPKEYYEDLLQRLMRIRRFEYPERKELPSSSLEVFHLYPGHLKPDALFNRIEWELDAGDLNGAPYTSVLIDGIHNVFLQFPEIEAHHLFWPQMFNALRLRDVTLISTHTTLALSDDQLGASSVNIDDGRSSPLRHALVQKTDFRISVGPEPRDHVSENHEDDKGVEFIVQVLSAINQEVKTLGAPILWSRERLVFYKRKQPIHQYDMFHARYDRLETKVSE